MVPNNGGHYPTGHLEISNQPPPHEAATENSMVWRHPWFIVFALIVWFAVMSLVMRLLTAWDLRNSWGDLIPFPYQSDLAM